MAKIYHLVEKFIFEFDQLHKIYQKWEVSTIGEILSEQHDMATVIEEHMYGDHNYV